jgi:hypothetical protein
MWDEEEEVCITQQAREELWIVYQFPTTTTTQFRRGNQAESIRTYNDCGDKLSDRGAGIHRHRENGDRLSNGEYIFGESEGR